VGVWPGALGRQWLGCSFRGVVPVTTAGRKAGAISCWELVNAMLALIARSGLQRGVQCTWNNALGGCLQKCFTLTWNSTPGGWLHMSGCHCLGIGQVPGTTPGAQSEEAWRLPGLWGRLVSLIASQTSISPSARGQFQLDSLGAQLSVVSMLLENVHHGACKVFEAHSLPFSHLPELEYGQTAWVTYRRQMQVLTMTSTKYVGYKC
jgi:hypothetical protein